MGEEGGEKGLWNLPSLHPKGLNNGVQTSTSRDVPPLRSKSDLFLVKNSNG